MDGQTGRLSASLIERTSRRGALGRIGRGLVVLGAAAAGVSPLSPASAACSTCGGGGCTDGVGRGCGGTGRGGCTGSVVYNNNYTCGATYGLLNGWWWFCCQNGTKYVCQDCCTSSGGYVRTIKRNAPNTGGC